MARLASCFSLIRSHAMRMLCPQHVYTNQNSGVIRLIACLCMAVDHFGKMCFPQYTYMRLIGRLAFPLFAYGIAVGAVYTRDPMKYLRRLLLLALVSQPLYALALGHEAPTMYAVSFISQPLNAIWTFYINSWRKPSILLSLIAGLLLLLSLRKKQWIAAFFIYVLCERFSGSLDYGIFGIQLMLLFYLLCEYPAAALVCTSIFLISSSSGFGYIFFGKEYTMRIFALPAVVFACLPLRGNLRLPKWFSYGFYPAHLVLLALIVKLP